MTWRMRAAAPVACAMLALACGNADEPAANQRATQGPNPGPMQVMLTGCVQAAPGTNQYVLRYIELPPAAEQPSDWMSGPPTGITEGSWVKLRMGDTAEQIGDRVGKMVSVTGRITDTGLDSIGTSGQTYGPDDRGPRRDESRAATSEHHSDKVAKEAGPLGQQSLANGNAPEIAVERIRDTGKPCPQREEKLDSDK